MVSTARHARAPAPKRSPPTRLAATATTLKSLQAHLLDASSFDIYAGAPRRHKPRKLLRPGAVAA
jgi:hypothetical protein